MTPAVPTLAQLIAQMITPCLPYIFMSDSNPILHDLTLNTEVLPEIPQTKLRAGESIWHDLWPDISRDYETVTAVQKVARTPNSPVWQSALEQGLITILSRNEALAQKLAKKLRTM